MTICACGKPATCFVGLFGHMNHCCEECGDGMVACEHEEGTRMQAFDADGCGFYLWTCSNCGYTEPDSLP